MNNKRFVSCVCLVILALNVTACAKFGGHGWKSGHNGNGSHDKQRSYSQPAQYKK